MAQFAVRPTVLTIQSYVSRPNAGTVPGRDTNGTEDIVNKTELGIDKAFMRNSSG